jgi:hypothetical protein
MSSLRPKPRAEDAHGAATMMPTSTSSVAVPRIELTITHEAGVASSRRLVLDGDVFRIGSHPSNEVVLDDPRVVRGDPPNARASGQALGSGVGSRL